MTGDSSASTDSAQSHLSTLNEAIKMPANFAQALAVLVEALKSDNQLIGAVILAIILVLIPVLIVISLAPSREIAILVTTVWCITMVLALSGFLTAFILVKFRKRGKETFAAEHREDLKAQLLHAQNALIKLRSYVEPLDKNVTWLVQQEQIRNESAAQLIGQLNELKGYLVTEEREINHWLGRLASVTNMDTSAAAKRRQARWAAREAAQREKQNLNS
jgi:hypothetical protein